MEHNPLPNGRKMDWLGALLKSSFECCEDHKDIRFNGKNMFCIDCKVDLCRHCMEVHSLHRRFQIYKYSHQNVVRHSAFHKFFDCSSIQTYVCKNERIVHLKPQTSSKEFKKAKRSKVDNLCCESKSKEDKVATPPKRGGVCEKCGKHLQDKQNRFCSITCKISVLQPNQSPTKRNCSAQRILEDGAVQQDNQNSKTESTVFVSESYECFEVVNFRKRKRKVTPEKTCHFVFPY